MYKRKIQTSYDKKLKMPIYEELSYEFFAEHVGYEYWFKYKDKTIDIAHFEDKETKKIKYHISINGFDKDAILQIFDSPEELLEKGKVDGKTIKEIWEELENTVV